MQKELLEILVSDAPNRPQDRQRKPVIANEIALGYTYQDVLDADQEGQAFQAANAKVVQLTISRYTCQNINILSLRIVTCLRSSPETAVHTTIHTRDTFNHIT